MTAKEAVKLMLKIYPTKEPTGYWVIDDGFIINTKSVEELSGPAQFVVKADGTVYGTNPMMHDFSLTTMKKF